MSGGSVKTRRPLILVADDDATNRIITAEPVHGWGMRPSAAAGAAEDLAALQHALAAGAPFPLARLEAMSPAVDRLTLVERVR